MIKHAGIWIDYRTADIFKMEGGKTMMMTVPSEIHTGNVKGGSRSTVPWGPMDKVSESKMLNKKNAEKESYYERVREAVAGFDRLMIIGPGMAKEEFRKFLGRSKKLHPRVIVVRTMDSGTQNQKKARIEELFAEQ